MKETAKRGKGDSEALKKWTARLQAVEAVRGSSQRAPVLPADFKKNPGGTIRDLYHVWAQHFGSARGRKRVGKDAAPPAMTARERLEGILKEMYGKGASPIRSLYAKLAGRTPVTIRNAERIVAAIVHGWPLPLSIVEGARTPADRIQRARDFAEFFIQELLSDLSGGRSREWRGTKLDQRVFMLVNEERIGARQFVKEACEPEGALIVAGTRNVLVGVHPVDIIRQFHELTSYFVAEGSKGLLIFVVDAAILQRGDDRFNMLYNLGLLSTAVTAFALFQDVQEESSAIQVHSVDWSRWRAISSRCCVVMRRPPLVDPVTGKLLSCREFDEFVSGWKPHEDFEPLPELPGFAPFEREHVLPRTYPPELGGREALIGRDLYWDVLVRPTEVKGELSVEYFVPPPQKLADTAEAQEGGGDKRFDDFLSRSTRGRPPAPTQPVEEDTLYITRRESPGPLYDEAQKAIYLAAKGRLKLDTGARHVKNLGAAAALRQIGFEVLPVSVALSLLPRSLHFASAAAKGSRMALRPQ